MKHYINPSNYDTADEYEDALDRAASRYEAQAAAADDAWSERMEDDA